MKEIVMHPVRSRTRIRQVLIATVGSLACATVSMAQQQATMVKETVNGQTTTIMTDGSGTAVMTLPDGSVQTFDISGASPGGAISITGSGDPKAPRIMANGGPGKILDLSQIRQNVLDQLKTAMGCSDEEWAVILPKLEKVEAASIEVGAPANGLGPGVKLAALSGASGGRQPDVAQCQSQLRSTLQNPNATEAEVKLRIESLREARARAREKLAQARKELADVLTLRQEAVLIDRGILE
jgi:hypothetical protein